MFRWFNRLLLFLEDRLFPNIAVVFFLVSISWMLLEALSRSIFSKSFAISEEVTTFTMMWAILFSLAQAGKQGNHIKLDLVLNLLPKPVVFFLNVVTSCLGLLFSLSILYSLYLYMPHLYNIGLASHSPMRLPMWIVYSSMPIGAVLLCLYFIRDMIANAGQFVSSIRGVSRREGSDETLGS